MCIREPIPAAAQSKVLVFALLLGLRVLTPLGVCTSVSCECRLLTDRGLCVGLITHTEESYRVWCV